MITGEVTADGITAAIEQMTAEAAGLGAQAAEDRDRAEAVMASASERAAEIMNPAIAEHRMLTEGATAAERRAADLTQRAGWAGTAAARQREAEDAQSLAARLIAERETLAERARKNARQLAGIEGEQEDAAEQLDGALARRDVEAVKPLRATLDGLGAVAESLGAEQPAVLARLAAIGDGTEPGELKNAVTAAQQNKAAARHALNDAFPDTQEARAERAREHERVISQLAAGQAAAEARQGPPRQIVRLQG